MGPRDIEIRLMVASDLEEVIRIDEKVLNESRRDYYEHKFELLFASGEYLPTSLVAVDDNKKIVGFIMGEVYHGEFGISNTGAFVDTVGVDPTCQKLGIGKMLMDEFIKHLKELGVKKVHTLVDKTFLGLMGYFGANGFSPSKGVVSMDRDI